MLNEFIYKTQASVNTFKSKDSARLYYAQTWLLDQANGDAIIEGTDLPTSSDYIKQLLGIPLISTPVYHYDHMNSINTVYSRRAFGMDNYAASTRLITGEKNGNGLSMNPETAGGVDWAATVNINGVAKHIKFGGTTRGIVDSSVYGQSTVNGYSMKEIDYENPSNSGGASNPSICIDQSVGFRVVSKDEGSKAEPDIRFNAAPYVGDGWQIGKSKCTFKFFGVNGFGQGKGNLGTLYHFFKYLTTIGQEFRFTNDHTATTYKIGSKH